MLQSSFTLVSIRGIQVGVHYTWLLALGLITWSLAQGGLPAEWTEGTRWLVALAVALLLFVSVLIHELSHSFVAQSRGLTVHSITLFLFGGVSNIAGEARTPRDEFLVAAVGPISSLALGALFWVLLQVIGFAQGPVSVIVQYMASMNVALGAFNLVPGFPLDGGRVLRSILWAASGSMRGATKWSSLVGQAVGWSLIAYGVWMVFNGQIINGVWMGFIGWFLNNAAEQTRQQSEAMAAFHGVQVRDLMATDPQAASPEMSIERLVYDFAVRQGVRALPVVQDGRLLGIVTLTDIREAPKERWSMLTVGDIMTREPLRVSTPAQNVGDALQLMVAHDLHQLPVVEGDRLVGLISRTHIMRFVQLRNELGLKGARERTASAPTRGE